MLWCRWSFAMLKDCKTILEGLRKSIVRISACATIIGIVDVNVKIALMVMGNMLAVILLACIFM